jgi:hypothetical protein
MSRIKCADGYNVSIQASSGHYCTPRETMQDVQYYSSFELVIRHQQMMLFWSMQKIQMSQPIRFMATFREKLLRR